MFCKKCGTMVYPHEGVWECPSCGTTGTVGRRKRGVVTKRTQKEDTLFLEADTTNLPKTKALCEKCGHQEAYFHLRQTRSADEPETRIYRCAGCAYTWREY